MTYYYPNHLGQRHLVARLLTITDLVIILLLFIFSALTFIVSRNFFIFLSVPIYGFFSAKFINGVSITRLAILYAKFLLTDILIFYWR